MSFWTAAVVIVAILAFTCLKLARHYSKQERMNPPPVDDAAERREVEELRERIKVLERIATDGNTLDASETRRIAAEIEALREKQS